MAGLSNRPSLRDSLEVTDSTVPDLDAWAKSPERGGNVDGAKHAEYIQNVSRAIQLGQISEEGALNLAKRVKGLAPFILPAIGDRRTALQSLQQNKALIGQYINEGRPAIPDRPYTEQDVGTGIGPYQIESPIQGTGTPAIPAKQDYAGLVNALAGRGQVELAEKYQKLGGLDKKFSPGEITSVKLGAAYHDPSAYDPLSLVPQHGLQKSKNIYRGMFDNAKALERVKYTDERGVGRESIVPRSEIPSGGKSVSDFGQLHKDIQKVGESFEKTRMLENAIDELDVLFEKNPTSVRDATGNVKNLSLSDYVKSADARNATAIISTIEAEVIRKNAGLTQTESELARTKAMLARTAAYSAADFEKAFRRLQKTYAQEKRLAFNKLGKDGKEIAAERFGMNPDRLPWEERADEKKVATTKTLTPAQQRLRSLLDGR